MKKAILVWTAAAAILVAGCKKETQPAEENDNELITTVQLDFTERGSGAQTSFQWEDADGPGGEVPVMDTIRLDENSIYDVKVTFWNKSVTPAEDITTEVKGESESHRIYYDVSAGTGITIDGYDNDTGGMPLGVNSVWTTTANGSGNVVIVLRHYPDGGKAADDPVNSPKSTTDAGAIFEVVMGE